MTAPTPRRLVPATATGEMVDGGVLQLRTTDYLPDEAEWVYAAMLAASPHAGRVSREDVERVARALVRRQIEIARRWDTPPEKLASMIDRAVDHAWRDRLEDAEIAVAALGLEIEPAQEAGE
jgi:hypothetical protein